jgi:ubiquinone/menaquinone biosynthesis C-methylase UbiE
LKAEGVVADATLLPFRGNTFDFIICVDLIEHLLWDFKLLYEANKVLKSVERLLLLHKTHVRLTT